MVYLITATNNPDLHARLLKVMEDETRNGKAPGYVISGQLTYAVMQNSAHEVAFLPQSDRANYESTSLIK